MSYVASESATHPGVVVPTRSARGALNVIVVYGGDAGRSGR